MILLFPPTNKCLNAYIYIYSPKACVTLAIRNRPTLFLIRQWEEGVK